jgi:hypothetical protein
MKLINLHWSHSNLKFLGIEFSLDLNCITEINFSKKIKEVSAILKSWQHRKLTLMGKISYKISCLRQSKTSLQKGFFKLTEISLSFSFCRYKTLSPPYCLRSVKNNFCHLPSGCDLINHENKQFYSFEQIQEKLETNNFLKFYRLIARIPKAFNDCLKIMTLS